MRFQYKDKEAESNPKSNDQQGRFGFNHNRALQWLVLGLLTLFAIGIPIDGIGENRNRFNLPDEIRPHQYRFKNMVNVSRPNITAFAHAPNEPDSLYIAVKPGVVYRIENIHQPEPKVFLDLSDRTIWETGESGLHSLAFHPNYGENGYFYVFYSTTATSPQGVGEHDRLARFQVSAADPSQADPESEVPMIQQYRLISLHHAGDLKFGPDGYLYLGLGDASSHNDYLGNSQRIDKNFHAGILRLDVDEAPDNLLPNPHPGVLGGYRIPKDNPFIEIDVFNGKPVDPEQVRTEFYAVGLRNPWKMSFDPVTSDLYAIDTGGDLQEEVNLIQKGGNYGWAIMEGDAVLKPDQLAEIPEPSLLPPSLLYEHNRGNTAITAGLLYRGDKFPEFDGKFIFADWGGNIGVYQPGPAPQREIQWIARQTLVTDISLLPATGDILFSDLLTGRILQLLPPVVLGSNPPDKLSETGVFQDTQRLILAEAFVPYELNHPFWSDDAIKQRWVSTNAENEPVQAFADRSWQIPQGTVFVKHFEMEMRTGDPDSRRRLETRLLMKTADSVYGVTYRWDEDNEDAHLVPDSGLEEEIWITDPDGTSHSQTWLYPSRTECLDCHTEVGGHALGFSTPQINRSTEIHGTRENQLLRLIETGSIQGEVEPDGGWPRYVDIDDTFHSVEYRVRSYLAANCASCHQPGGPTLSTWDARLTTPTDQMQLINHNVQVYSFWNNHRLVDPGVSERSMLPMRLSSLGSFYMPPTGSFKVNTQGMNLVKEWVDDFIPSNPTFQSWQKIFFEGPLNPDVLPIADPDGDGNNNYSEFLLGTIPTLPDSNPLQLSIEIHQDQVRIHFLQLANRRYQVQYAMPNQLEWRNLESQNKELLFAAENRSAIIEDTIDDSKSRYYRILIFSF